MNCWKCGAQLEDFPGGKIPFRATCDKCQSYLHCCKNCQFYKPGRANDCLIPGTEFIADREAANFCEEFKPLGKGPDKPKSNNSGFDALFKD